MIDVEDSDDNEPWFVTFVPVIVRLPFAICWPTFVTLPPVNVASPWYAPVPPIVIEVVPVALYVPPITALAVVTLAAESVALPATVSAGADEL
ncbi:hypothetical protein [Paraburkholderia terrae]